MWKAEHTSTINAPITKTWEVLTTPNLWVEVDSKHFKAVEYPEDKLKVGVGGKMKNEDMSMAFPFNVAKVDAKKHQTITTSKFPSGKLTITKTLVPASKGISFEETVVAEGLLTKLFVKIFFQKQIADTLPAQHKAIKKYVEGK